MQVAHGPFDVSQLLHIVDCVSGLVSSGIIIEELDTFEHFGGQRNGIHGVEGFKLEGPSSRSVCLLVLLIFS